MYPTFAYNAVGGGGYAQVEDLGNGLLRLTFDPNVSFEVHKDYFRLSPGLGH